MNRYAPGAVVLAFVIAACGGADGSSARPSPAGGSSASTTTPATPSPSTSTSPMPTSAVPTSVVPVTPVPSTDAPAPIATSPTTAPVTGQPAPVTGSASAGCATPAAPASTLSVTSGGASRTSLLALPNASTAPAPLVIDLHGLAADASQQSAYSRLAELGPSAGIVVATPESSGGPFWVLPVAPGTRDVVFVRDLIAAISAQYCIDTARVVVTGISNGGGLAAGVGCELADVVTAVVPVSGVNIAPTCEAPSSIVAFHGTADPIIPYDGGSPFAGGGRTEARMSAGSRDLASLSLPSVETVVSGWAGANGCTASVDENVGDVVHRVWSGCRAGRVAELYAVVGGGHTWPGAAPVPALGETTLDVDASQVVIDLAIMLSRT